VLDSEVEHVRSTLLDEVELVHMALPEADLSSTDLRVNFLDKELAAPLMITGMTGGHSVAEKINCALAKAASSVGVALGVGSQRAAIENPSLVNTFRSARECGGSELVVIANIGAPQLVKGYTVKELRKAVEMIDADAIAIHLNASQEAFQPEGDHDYRGVVDKIGDILDSIGVPVIVKETGHGISYEVALELYKRGIRLFDVSGAGGTSWVKVEYYRALRKDKLLALAAKTFAEWGIPTAQSIVETRWAAPTSCIIASGGVRTGLDAVKALALGADIAGVALPALKAYAEEGVNGVINLLKVLILEMRAALFLMGAKRVYDIRRREIVVSHRLEHILKARGINVGLYLHHLRKAFYPCQWCS
jgi:isopentenyl-diphosphate delta-isomerase